MPDAIVLQDPIEAMIRGSGWLDNPDLWRRWIFTQMIRTCKARDIEAFQARFFDARPYAYQWETVTRELKMRVKATQQEQAMRPMFFPFFVLTRMLSDYKDALDRFVENPRRRKKDGNGVYVSVKGERIYLEPTPKHPSIALYQKRADKAMSRIRQAQRRNSYRLALDAIKTFASTALLTAALPKSKAWMDGFTGNGAYYTMDNLIRFHQCRFTGFDKKPLSEAQSLNKLASMAASMRDTPDAMFDLMSALLDANPEIARSLFRKINTDE